MKKTINKIKVSLTMLWVAVTSFFSRVIGESVIIGRPGDDDYYGPELLYWVKDPRPAEIPQILHGIRNIWQRVLIGVVFIIWIISFFRIRKTKDKTLKKKRTKIAIIVISILLIVLIESIIYKFVG